jgi:Fe-S cluster biogenesis protein NfuA
MINVVDIEATPNPDALKFVVDRSLVDGGTRSYDTADAASNDPFAQSLFSLGGVKTVFYGDRFVTITKAPYLSWEDLTKPVVTVIQNSAGPAVPAVAPAAGAPAADALLARINDVLDNNVRPALAGDGGGLQVMGFDAMTLRIHYQGACGSCPSATAGTLRAIENLLQKMIDPRLRVVNA